MLKEYLAEVEGMAATARAGEAAEEQGVAALRGELYLLRDPTRFPDPQINIVAGVLGYVLRQVGVRVPQHDDLDEPVLLFETPKKISALRKVGLALPIDYHYRVKDDPLSSLANMAVAAERVRNFLLHGKQASYIHMPLGERCEQRVQARMGGVVHTLGTMAAEELLAVELSDELRQVAEQYPRGFADLPPECTHLGIAGREMPEKLGGSQADFLADAEAQAALANYHTVPAFSAGFLKLVPRAFGSLGQAERALRGVDSVLHIHMADGSPDLMAVRHYPDNIPGHACTRSPEAYEENLQALDEW